MTDIELNKCLYCGSKACYLYINPFDTAWCVGCSNRRCSARGPMRKTPYGAAKVWNKYNTTKP